ncbi:MAG: hypothetical protein GF388_08220 [Candidatus Aegiribacteria sp.]|nr:hypothetical protein [Candidatus Aegiribacteria sp.]MBD3295071.1 hypothetical protein [Candidatus Fermentibacteria bacterium]
MEKKLLLLGLLKSSEMHGYRIIKLLENSSAIPIGLTKANGYRLLSVMEKDGWITHRTEKDGNRPKKRVYSLTETGEKAFIDLLRKNLSSLPRPEFPGLVGLDLIGCLPSDEASELLSVRLKLLEEHFHDLDDIPESVMKSHPSIRYMHRYYSAELDWIREMIRGLHNNV